MMKKMHGDKLNVLRTQYGLQSLENLCFTQKISIYQHDLAERIYSIRNIASIHKPLLLTRKSI